MTKEQAQRAFLAGAAAEDKMSHASVLIHIGDETRYQMMKRRRAVFEKWWLKFAKAGIAVLLLTGCGERSKEEARVQAAKLLLAPVICDGEAAGGPGGCANDGGYFCQAKDGQSVYCGGHDDDMCYVIKPDNDNTNEVEKTTP